MYTRFKKKGGGSMGAPKPIKPYKDRREQDLINDVIPLFSSYFTTCTKKNFIINLIDFSIHHAKLR